MVEIIEEQVQIIEKEAPQGSFRMFAAEKEEIDTFRVNRKATLEERRTEALESIAESLIILKNKFGRKLL